MARKKLFEFRKDGKKVEVFTGDGTLDVYFKVNNGSSRPSGLTHIRHERLQISQRNW